MHINLFGFQVNIFLRRAFYESVDKLYCLAFADFLEYSIAEKVEKKIIEYSEKNKDNFFKLVIFCTQENKFKKRLVGALEKYRRQLPALYNPTVIAKYLSYRLVCQDEPSACAVDFSR
ncbi:hypothetical protein SNE40_020744 [Patella caerulea]|uniref:Uncharacterized protein n=1 Tax=Patella caerulea TaxID=87958 RepID=A0AAN8PG87_PATCE